MSVDPWVQRIRGTETLDEIEALREEMLDELDDAPDHHIKAWQERLMIANHQALENIGRDFYWTAIRLRGATWSHLGFDSTSEDAEDLISRVNEELDKRINRAKKYLT